MWFGRKNLLKNEQDRRNKNTKMSCVSHSIIVRKEETETKQFSSNLREREKKKASLRRCADPWVVTAAALISLMIWLGNSFVVPFGVLFHQFWMILIHRMACRKVSTFKSRHFCHNKRNVCVLIYYTQMFAKVEQRDAVVQFHGQHGIDDRMRSS